MTWLAPALAGIAAAIAVPALLILYFLKLRRRQLEVSTTLLWKKSIEDLQANAPFQKLRRNILLLLQLLILAAALVAVGQPQFTGDAPPGARHIIMLDRSASMGARDAVNDRGEPVSRLDAAKAEAIKLVESLRAPGLFDKESGDQAMVIAFDTAAEVRQTFTADKAVLRGAIDGVAPIESPTLADEAFRLARAQAPRLPGQVETYEDGTQRIVERPPGSAGTLHVWSDGRFADADKVAPGPEDIVVFHAVGKADAVNVGNTSLRAGRDFNDPNRLSIFVGLQSTDRAARRADVELRIDGAVAGIKSVDLPPAAAEGGATGAAQPGARVIPGTGGVAFTMDRSQGGIVSVTLTAGPGAAEDVLRADDTAWLIVPPAKKLAVAVVTAGDLFLAAALEGLPLARLDTFTSDQYEARMARPGSSPVEYDVVILDGWLPPAPGAETSLPPGRFLIFNAVPPPPTGLVDKGKGAATVIIDWSRSHPALRGLSLDNVWIADSRLVEIPEGSAATTIATAESGPAILEINTARTRAIVIPFDVAGSSWPFEVSFVVFVASSIGYLGEDGGSLGGVLQPGGTLTDRLPPDASDVRVRLPDGSESSVQPALDGRIVYGPVTRSGVYTVTWNGPPGPTDGQLNGRTARPYAANLLDARESEVGAATELALGSKLVQANPQQQGKVTRKLWPWLVLAALAIIMLEWFVYNRKVHV